MTKTQLISLAIILAAFAISALSIETSQHSDLVDFIEIDQTNTATYIYGTYDCVDFSIDLAENLTEAGYDSGLVLIAAKDVFQNVSHMIVWIKISNETIYIKSMSDCILTPEKYSNEVDHDYFEIYEMSIELGKLHANNSDMVRLWKSDLS